jgi:predicted Zn finger-like uncharacterized protein
MNNACPSCGAVYAVAAKDIGRKIKCKKCGAALIVSDAGLVLDGPAAAPPPPPAAEAFVAVAESEDDYDADDEVVSTKSKNKKAKRDRAGGGGPNLTGMLTKVGGLTTVLFSIGVFLVIWFTFMSKIGDAATLRAEAYSQKLEAEAEAKMKALTKGKAVPTKEDELKKYVEDAKKIHDEYEPKMLEATEDAKTTRINNLRSIWFDRYGVMFGFILVAFGCIGFLRTEQPLVMRIVAGAILTLMMLVVFASFSSCGGESTPRLPPSSSNSLMGPGGMGMGAGGLGLPGGAPGQPNNK